MASAPSPALRRRLSRVVQESRRHGLGAVRCARQQCDPDALLVEVRCVRIFALPLREDCGGPFEVAQEELAPHEVEVVDGVSTRKADAAPMQLDRLLPLPGGVKPVREVVQGVRVVRRETE